MKVGSKIRLTASARLALNVAYVTLGTGQGIVTKVEERERNNHLLHYKCPNGLTDTIDQGWVEIATDIRKRKC